MVFGSTSMNPRSSTRTPASSAPMPSVTGRRPIETSTWSTSILSEPFGVSNGTTTPVLGVLQGADPGLGVDRQARACFSDRASTSAQSRSGPIGSTPCGSASSSVVATPRSV